MNRMKEMQTQTSGVTETMKSLNVLNVTLGQSNSGTRNIEWHD